MATPEPLFDLNFTPLGSVPASVRVGVGEPDVVTWNDPAAPTVNVALLTEVMAAVEDAAATAWLEPVAADAAAGTPKTKMGTPNKATTATVRCARARPPSRRVKSNNPPPPPP